MEQTVENKNLLVKRAAGLYEGLSIEFIRLEDIEALLERGAVLFDRSAS